VFRAVLFWKHPGIINAVKIFLQLCKRTKEDNKRYIAETRNKKIFTICL